MRKSKLVIDPLFDFDLIGIISHAKGHRIAWEINQILGIELAKAKDQIIRFTDGNSIIVLNYSYNTENAGIFLLRNRSIELQENKQLFLLPELAEFDYLLRINGADSFDSGEMVEALREVKIIQFAALLDPENLKSKENLVFDHE